MLTSCFHINCCGLLKIFTAQNRLLTLDNQHSWMPTCFQEIHACQLVPFSAFPTMHFLSSLREHGYVSLLSQEVWLQLPSYICSLSEPRPSNTWTPGVIISIHRIMYPAWNLLSKKKILGVLSLLVVFVQVRTTTNTPNRSPGPFPAVPGLFFQPNKPSRPIGFYQESTKCQQMTSSTLVSSHTTLISCTCSTPPHRANAHHKQQLEMARNSSHVGATVTCFFSFVLF